jgi:hypothetical protein
MDENIQGASMSKLKVEGYAAFIMAAVLGICLLTGVYGWVNNIIQLIMHADMSLAHLTLMTVLRIVGIFFFPLGAVLGLV